MRVLLITLFFIATYSTSAQTLPDNFDISGSPNGVIPFPSGQGSAFSSFTKYTKLTAPNGQAIHIMAQSALTDAQIVRARNILQFYLTDFPGSQYGSDKSAVFNQMTNNNAMLMLLNGADGDGNPPGLNAQPLYQNELPVEGDSWYINNNYEHRDAAFEEILHLMHDTGIGVDGPNTQPGALPAYQAEIRAAQDNADNNFAIWPIGESATGGWYAELAQENSLSQEYLASVVDSYYGLWGPWTEQSGYGMWGLYISQTRGEIPNEDPMGNALMPKYFSPSININMDIHPSFSGTFDMTFDASLPYTHKSQYLQHITLTGSNASNAKGNSQWNRLNGNNANNTLEGRAGNDRLDGKQGEDTAIFTGMRSEYSITAARNSTTTIVTDNTANRDGVDTLYNIEKLQFADQTINNSVALPIEWGYFNVKAQSENALIRWSSLQEINNDGYIVQRQDEGKWINIAEIKGQKNTAEETHYSYLDQHPNHGVNYYRIIQRDIDGSQSISEIESCTITFDLNIKVYPNPVSETLSIETGIEKSVGIIIYDQQGNRILAGKVDGSLDIPVADWSNGIYYLTTDSRENTIQFIKN